MLYISCSLPFIDNGQSFRLSVLKDEHTDQYIEKGIYADRNISTAINEKPVLKTRCGFSSDLQKLNNFVLK